MELDFKKYLTEIGLTLNAAGRSGQHFWKPENPVVAKIIPLKKPKKFHTSLFKTPTVKKI